MSDLMQVLDANLNRSMEGLRVCEDLLRFSHGTEISFRLKIHRQYLGEIRQELGNEKLLAARNTESDEQKFLDGNLEKKRKSVEDIFTANIKRAQESTRVIEEILKTIDLTMSNNIQKLRFTLYNDEVEALSFIQRKNFQNQFYYSLYGILDSEFLKRNYEKTAQEMIDGGVKVLQLRMKHASSKEILKIAKKIAILCEKSGILFIMNDYPDIAVLSKAHGIHLGQDDIPVDEARKIVGDRSIIGISTHCEKDIDKALKTSADYIAVGPVFGTTSKVKESLPAVGTDLISYALEKSLVPVVPIGGITLENIEEILKKGALCPAVISALYKNDEIKKNSVSFVSKISHIQKELSI